MPEVFAQNFDLTAPNGADPYVLFHEALGEWVGQRWPKGSPWFSLEEPDSLRAVDGSIYRWEPFFGADTALLDFSWRHPHVASQGIAWSTRVSLYRSGKRLRLAVRVGNTGPELGEAGYLPTTRPRLLLSLVGRFAVRSDNFSLRLWPQPLSDAAFRDLVRYVLLDPKRQHPVIILTPQPSGSFEVPPETIAKDFLSLGEMYCPEDHESTFALTDEVGKRHSVFRGALRVYMPGLSNTDNPFRHPLLLPRLLADATQRLRLAQFLASYSVRRFREDPLFAALRDERAVNAEDRRKKLMIALAEAKAAPSAQDYWQQVADDLDRENKALRAGAEDLGEQLEIAQTKIRALQFSLKRAREAGGAPDKDDDIQFLPDSVLEAVETAQVEHYEQLNVLQSATDSAAQSPYARPADVYKALEALATIGAKMKTGPLGKNLRTAFAEEGQDYRQASPRPHRRNSACSSHSGMAIAITSAKSIFALEVRPTIRETACAYTLQRHSATATAGLSLVMWVAT